MTYSDFIHIILYYIYLFQFDYTIYFTIEVNHPRNFILYLIQPAVTVESYYPPANLSIAHG